MIELIGWQNPLIEYQDVPLHIRIYEQLMLKVWGNISTCTGKSAKPKKSVIAWDRNGTIIRFESRSLCAAYFDISKETVRLRIKDKRNQNGWYFRFEYPIEEEE